MGAWGVGPMDNDTAMDAVSIAQTALKEGKGLRAAVESALSTEENGTADWGFTFIGLTDWIWSFMRSVPTDLVDSIPLAVRATRDDWANDSARVEAMRVWAESMEADVDFTWRVFR